MAKNQIEGDQQYLWVTAAEAYTMAHNAPEGTIFNTRLKVELVNEDGKPMNQYGRADITVPRETFKGLVLRMLEGEQEAEGARIPLTKQVWETGQIKYWIG